MTTRHICEKASFPKIANDSESSWGAYFKYRKSCCVHFGAWVLVLLQGGAVHACVRFGEMSMVMCALEPGCWCRCNGAAHKYFVLSGVYAGTLCRA